ncbi:hypothetical protein STANM309S_06181 [Streptomyces tanashiensis]
MSTTRSTPPPWRCTATRSSADLPENHRFAIPGGVHWADLRKVTSNVGTALKAAMRAIESANPDTLTGVFGDGEWTNKDLLPDSHSRT